MTCGTTTIQFKTNQGKFEAIVVTSTDHIALCVISHSDQYLLHCHKKCTVSQSNGTTIGQYRVEHRVTGCYDIGNDDLVLHNTLLLHSAFSHTYRGHLHRHHC